MGQDTRRFMRMLVFFDLPVVTKTDRRAYTVFRRFLLNDGYDMIQFSVYGRILNGDDAAEKHMQRLLNNLPPEGSVRVLTVTEKQFGGGDAPVLARLIRAKIETWIPSTYGQLAG